MFNIETSYPSVSFCWWIKTSKHRDQCSFSSSIWTQKTEHLSFFDSKREILGSNFLSSSSSAWINLSNIFDDKRILVIVSLVKIVNNISLRLRVSVLKTGLIIVHRYVVSLSVFLKVSDLIIIVSDTLGSWSTCCSLSSLGAKPVPLLWDTIALWNDLVKVPG